MRRTPPLVGRILRSAAAAEAPAAAGFAAGVAGTSASLGAATPAPVAAAALLAAARGARSFASGPMDVGLPRPPQTPSGMVPDADGMLPTTAALKNPSADIL